MKKEYNIKDKVWIHLGERNLVEGRVVEIIDLEHLGEGHNPTDELYIIEIKTGIDDVYEVRSFNEISPDARGPINLFRKDKKVQAEAIKGNRFMKKIGVTVPAMDDPLTELAKEINEELTHPDDPTPEEIHAAIEKAQQAATHQPLHLKASKPKRKYYRKKTN